jgi:hypothetical protein
MEHQQSGYPPDKLNSSPIHAAHGRSRIPSARAKAATVKATPAKAGDSLAVDQIIVEFE